MPHGKKGMYVPGALLAEEPKNPEYSRIFRNYIQTSEEKQ